MKKIPAGRRTWGIWVPKSLSVCSLRNTSLLFFLRSSITFISKAVKILLCFQLKAIRLRISIQTGSTRGAKPRRTRCLRPTRIPICLTSLSHAIRLPATSAWKTFSAVLLCKYRRCTSMIASRRAKTCSINISRPGRRKFQRHLRTCGPILKHFGRHNDENPKRQFPSHLLLPKQPNRTGCPKPLSPWLRLSQTAPLLHRLATSREPLIYPARKRPWPPPATEPVLTSRHGGLGHPSDGKVGGERRVGKESSVRQRTGQAQHHRQS